MNNGDMPKITYIYDPGAFSVEILIDGEIFTEWPCNDDPQGDLAEFRRIYMAGYNRAIRDMEGK